MLYIYQNGLFHTETVFSVHISAGTSLAGILAAIYHTVLLHTLEVHDLDHGVGTLRYGDSKGDAGKCDEIAPLIAKFCDDSLSEEFKAICLLLLEKLCRKRLSPLLKGREETWVAVSVYAITASNFIFVIPSLETCL